MSLQNKLKHEVMSPTGKCTREGMFENVQSNWKKTLKLLLSRIKEWRILLKREEIIN